MTSKRLSHDVELFICIIEIRVVYTDSPLSTEFLFTITTLANHFISPCRQSRQWAIFDLFVDHQINSWIQRPLDL